MSQQKYSFFEYKTTELKKYFIHLNKRLFH